MVRSVYVYCFKIGFSYCLLFMNSISELVTCIMRSYNEMFCTVKNAFALILNG